MRSPGWSALGVFPDLDGAMQALGEVRGRGIQDVELLSPFPVEEAHGAADGKASPVWLWTLCGCVLGCASGFALTIWTSLDRPLMTGGKPIVSLPPFVVIAFELTILLGAIGTLVGFLLHARLARFATEAAYDPRFSEDCFGISVRCDADQASAVEETLRALGAREVRVEEA